MDSLNLPPLSPYSFDKWSMQDTGQIHHVQGTMFTAKYIINDFEYSNSVLSPEDIKQIMLQQLVKELYKGKAVEFTKMADNFHNQHVFHARIFALPDAQVRVLRENNITKL